MGKKARLIPSRLTLIPASVAAAAGAYAAVAEIEARPRHYRRIWQCESN